MNFKTPRLSRRDLMVASGMLAVGAGSGVWWAQRDLVEVDHHGLNLQDVKSADAALARLVVAGTCSRLPISFLATVCVCASATLFRRMSVSRMIRFRWISHS